jgi:hypothetical protein
VPIGLLLVGRLNFQAYNATLPGVPTTLSPSVSVGYELSCWNCYRLAASRTHLFVARRSPFTGSWRKWIQAHRCGKPVLEQYCPCHYLLLRNSAESPICQAGGGFACRLLNAWTYVLRRGTRSNLEVGGTTPARSPATSESGGHVPSNF